ncbi:MAG: S8 family serine peptidase, partial [Ignisphaera sp.]
DFLESLDISLSSNCSVVNMSLGALIPDREATLLEPSMFRLAENESIVVASSGNEGRFDAVSYPARSKYAIGVGAIDNNYMRAWYSNIDPSIRKPEVAFFGDRINCATINNRYNVWSGTSFSAPAVSSILYWIYYFYYYAKSNNLPIGYIISSDPKKRWVSDGRRVLIELAKRNNPILGEWNVEYGYGVPSYRRLTVERFNTIFLRSSQYRRPMPSPLATAIPTPIYINIPELNKLIQVPSISTEQIVYNYYYNYITQQHHQYITQYVTNQHISTARSQAPTVIRFIIHNIDATAPCIIVPRIGAPGVNLRELRYMDITFETRYAGGKPILKVVGLEDYLVMEEVIASFELESGKRYSVVLLAVPFDGIQIRLEGQGRVLGTLEYSYAR